MITLALARHAKSDWGDPSLPDHDRPLNDRGRRDAPRMAKRLAERGFRPARIISSTATRACSTASAYAAELGVAVDLDRRLYGADPQTLQGVAAESGVDSVLLVAHDPGLSSLAFALSHEISHMPTCAVATFEWDADDWAEARATAPASWRFDEPR
ncbi:histidine phosphatase family protein [Microbacterium sp. 18062]|uniref:SixA phosphatase family protein n=1 Tax=Microbacterium sp. 18062 TaxID=2681410 RepID=UPI00135797CC|nr:histidine phosphatase family protein [Microbacterium sp. 18062]